MSRGVGGYLRSCGESKARAGGSFGGVGPPSRASIPSTGYIHASPPSEMGFAHRLITALKSLCSMLSRRRAFAGLFWMSACGGRRARAGQGGQTAVGVGGRPMRAARGRAGALLAHGKAAAFELLRCVCLERRRGRTA